MGRLSSNPIPNPIDIPESDKPFILALIGTLGLFGVGAYAIVTGSWDQAKDFVAIITPVVSMGWAFYFKAKS